MNKKTVYRNNNLEEVRALVEYAQELDLDDEQLAKLNRFLKLDIYEKDLIIMKSKGLSLREMGDEFGVSFQWIYQHLIQTYKKINK